jgi:hypothetical protein
VLDAVLCAVDGIAQPLIVKPDLGRKAEAAVCGALKRLGVPALHDVVLAA